MKQIMPAATIPLFLTSDIQLPKPKQNQGAEHRLMRRHCLLPPTHTYGCLKKLYTRCRNANLFERIMMIMIMTMFFTRRTQRR